APAEHDWTFLAPRCTARSKRSGQRCRAPAVRGWRVCRMGMATIDTLALRCAAASTMHYRAEKAHSEVGLAVMFVRPVVNLTIFCMGLMLILTSYLPRGAPGEAASGHAAGTVPISGRISHRRLYCERTERPEARCHHSPNNASNWLQHASSRINI